MEKRKQDIVLELICKHFGIKKYVILSKSRNREVSMARHMFVYILREHCAMTLVKIAEEIPNYDHSMVIYAHTKMKGLILSEDRLVFTIYKKILNELKEEEITIHPKLVISYPRGFNIQEVIRLINSKHENLKYELI